MAGNQAISSVINVVVVGAATIFIGLWLQQIQSEQQTNEAKIASNTKNIEKVFAAYNSRSETYRQMALENAKLRREVDEIRQQLEKNTQTIGSQQESIAAQIRSAQTSITTSLQKQQSDVAELVRNELKSQLATTAQATPQSTLGFITDDTVYKAVEKAAERPFATLYALPPEGGKLSAFLVTDQDETFFVNKSDDVILPAWNEECRVDFVRTVKSHVGKQYRHNREEFNKIVIENIPEAIREQLKATSLSDERKIVLDSIAPNSDFLESSFTVLATLKAGPIQREEHVTVDYTDLPGLLVISSTPEELTLSQ